MNDLRTAAQQAEAVEPVAWRTFDGEGGYDYRTYADNENYAAEWAQRNPRHVGWVEPLYTAPPQQVAQQAEPLNLRDPAVQKRLATQWGYVPAAAQAEPVEPVAGVVLNEEGRAALVEHGREEWHCVSRNARRLYIAPPQRKLVPLTEEEIMHIGMTHQSLRQVVRAVERAHGIEEQS